MNLTSIFALLGARPPRLVPKVLHYPGGEPARRPLSRL